MKRRLNGLIGRKRSATQEPDRRAAFRSLAVGTGGEFIEGRKLTDDQVTVTHGPWRIRLTIVVVQVGSAPVWLTRATAYFGGRRDLKMTVRKRNALDRLVEMLGWRERARLSPAFTDRYVVSGKPSARLPSLFASAALAEAILACPSVRLEIKRVGRQARRSLGEDVGVVVCQTSGIVVDVGLLVGLIDVVREALDAVRRVGEANAREVE